MNEHRQKNLFSDSEPYQLESACTRKMQYRYWMDLDNL